MIKRRDNCISCGSSLSHDIVFIGNQFPSAIFLENDRSNELVSSSLNLSQCTNKDCTLVQLSYDYDLQYVFDHYPYESGTTATMKSILQDVVTYAKNIISLDSEDVVLDIGGNDGTLLSLIDKPVRARVNIDAAAGVEQRLSAPDYVHVHAKFSADAYKNLDLPNPKLITSTAMFYQLSDPGKFCRDVRDIMSDDSVFVLQMTYLGTMLIDNIFDNIVHEHVAYYSLFSLESLLNRVGLYVIDARVTDSYGGSLRVAIVKNRSILNKIWREGEYSHVNKLETEQRINTFEGLYAFDSRVRLLKRSITAILNYEIENRGPIWGFGASTKGNMLLQFLKINKDRMPCILDNNKKKIGKLTTGSLIPIVSEDEHIKNLPDHLFILPYYYTDAFVKVIKKNLQPNRKVNLFVPLPHPRFITVQQ